MSFNRNANITLLMLVICSGFINDCNQGNPPTSSPQTSEETDPKQASDSPLPPGFRWTYGGNNGQLMFLETSVAEKISDVETIKVRTKGDSLFWSHELYVNWSDEGLRQIGKGYFNSVTIEHHPFVLLPRKLEIGQEWHRKSKTVDGDTSTGMAAKVIKRESITVPAGKFNTLMIEYTLGFHFGTEQDFRIWLDDEIGIVRIEKWQQSTLGEKEAMENPVVYELQTKEPLETAHRIDYPSKPIANDQLPKNVVAPEGKLTLFADYNDLWRQQVVLYFVNKTKEEVGIPAQDSDLYVKLETQTESGEWVRAQTHQSSWCGNSYHSRSLEPGKFITLLGFQPRRGQKQPARFSFYSKVDAVSNIGELRIDKTIIKAAQTDDLAPKHKEP